MRNAEEDNKETMKKVWIQHQAIQLDHETLKPYEYITTERNSNTNCKCN